MNTIKGLKKSELPFNWRELVQEKLKDIEPQVPVRKISDIKRGRTANFELSEKVIKAIREVKKEFDERKRYLRELQSLPEVE